MHDSRSLLLTLTLLLVAAPLLATSYVLVPDDRLAARADLIVGGRFLDSEASDAPGWLATEHGFEIEETVKGPDLGYVTVRVPGGVSEDLGRGFLVFGAPRFETGERALLFLGANGDGTFRVLHLLQGAFHAAVHEGRRILTRELPEGAPAGIDDPARDGDRFVAWLRDHLDGRGRPADYFVPRPELPRPDAAGAFTLLSIERLRWFDFDHGGAVPWHRHVDGQEGFRDGGKKAFKRARKSWKKRTGTPIRLANGGTTASTAGFDRTDSLNTILFSDPNELIGDDFECGGGGVVALGGISWVVASTRIWKGAVYFVVDEAEIIVNDGVSCFLAGNNRLAEEIYGHELGHTLGLGHACGDDDSPRCHEAKVLDDALMRAWIHGDGRGARMSDDDISGARFLYHPDFWAAPCHLEPGHKNFCRDCGPCGAGQGNCRKDAECLVGLVCAQNAGKNFGLKSGVNVCSES